MASYSQMLLENDPSTQSYSANVNVARSIAGQEQLRKTRTGRNPYVTQGQRIESGMLTGVSPVQLAGITSTKNLKNLIPFQEERKSIYEFGKTSIGRIYSKNQNRTDFLGLSEDAEIGDAGFARLQQGYLHTQPKNVRPNTIKRRKNEANNLIREYRAYIAKLEEENKKRKESQLSAIEKASNLRTI